MKLSEVMVEIDPSSLRSRIETRLKELKKSVRGASLEAGLGASTIRNILEGKSTAPRIDTLMAIAGVLQVERGWLLSENEPREFAPGNRSTAIGRHRPLIPLYIPHFEEKGTLIISDNKLLVDSPPELSQVEGAYAIMMKGFSMYPVYGDGSVLFINPTLEPLTGFDYLFYGKQKTRFSSLTVGRLVTVEDTKFVFRQHQQPDLVYDAEFAHTKHIHAIIGERYRSA